MLFFVQHGYRVIGIDRRGHDFEIESSGSYVTPDEKALLLTLLTAPRRPAVGSSANLNEERYF
jgi:hypothetical protein